MVDQREARTDLSWGRFAWHFVLMVVAMVAGMMLLDPVWRIFTRDVPFFERTDVEALVMATNMTIGMTLLMLFMRHRLRPVVEMALAMYVPFVVFLVPYWFGAVSEDTVMMGGHVLMLVAMLGVMLARRAEYSAPHTRHASGH